MDLNSPITVLCRRSSHFERDDSTGSGFDGSTGFKDNQLTGRGRSLYLSSAILHAIGLIDSPGIVHAFRKSDMHLQGSNSLVVIQQQGEFLGLIVGYGEILHIEFHLSG